MVYLPSNRVSCDLTTFLTEFLAVVNCGSPPAIANGQIHGSDFTYNATVTYSCIASNFKLSGPQERTCQADGTWSGTQPECLGKHYSFYCVD